MRPKIFVETPTRTFREGASISEQFADFFAAMTRRPLTDDEQIAMAEIFKEIRQ